MEGISCGKLFLIWICVLQFFSPNKTYSPVTTYGLSLLMELLKKALTQHFTFSQFCGAHNREPASGEGTEKYRARGGLFISFYRSYPCNIYISRLKHCVDLYRTTYLGNTTLSNNNNSVTNTLFTKISLPWQLIFSGQKLNEKYCPWRSTS